MTTINSLTTSLYVSQTTISISSTKSAYSDDGQERPAVSGSGEKHGHLRHGGGAFMQNVVQTLQSFGLSIPGGKGGAGTDNESDAAGGQNNSSNLGQLLQTFLQDLRQVLKQSGLQQPAANGQADASPVQTPPKQISSGTAASASASASTAQTGQTASATSTGVPSNGATQAATATTTSAPSAPRATVADVREALHSFLHELRQALKYSADRRHGSDNTDKTTGRNGYGKFTDNLQNLITALGDSSGGAAGKYKELQDSFNNLVNLLGAAAGGKKPTLSEFLNKLAGNSDSSAPTPVAKGSIVSATA